jgi:hypothetical protein
VDLIGRAQDREKKQRVVKVVTHIWFHEMPKIFCLLNENLESLKYFTIVVAPLKGWNSSNIGGQT